MTTGSGLGFGDRAEAGGPVDPGPVPDAVGDAPRRAAGPRASVRHMSARGAADADPVTRCPADRPRGGGGPSAWREDPARPGRRGRPISSGSRLTPGARGGQTAGAGARGGVEPGCASAACALPGARPGHAGGGRGARTRSRHAGCLTQLVRRHTRPSDAFPVPFTPAWPGAMAEIDGRLVQVRAGRAGMGRSDMRRLPILRARPARLSGSRAIPGQGVGGTACAGPARRRWSFVGREVEAERRHEPVLLQDGSSFALPTLPARACRVWGDPPYAASEARRTARSPRRGQARRHRPYRSGTPDIRDDALSAGGAGR
mgnify:CR=1 FL=1